MIGRGLYLRGGHDELVQALVAFVAWCCSSKGNVASTISTKLAAVQYFHRVDAQVELPTGAAPVNRALKGVERAHVSAGTTRRVRVPVFWGTIWRGQHLIPALGDGGRVLWLCLATTYFLMARSEEMFASSAGGVHPTHCLLRSDVTFYAKGRALPVLKWHEATRVVVNFRGHKGDQSQKGSSVARTRTVAQGKRSRAGFGGGAVALLVELMSCHTMLPEDAPLCSFRSEGRTKVWGYSKALRALRELAESDGINPKHVGMHSLRIAAATTLAAGGEVPDRIIQREGRWKDGSGTFIWYMLGGIRRIRK